MLLYSSNFVKTRILSKILHLFLPSLTPEINLIELCWNISIVSKINTLSVYNVYQIYTNLVLNLRAQIKDSVDIFDDF